MKYLPTRFAAIKNPESFFSDLGDLIEERVEELRDVIAGDDPPAETYLNKLGRLNEATQSAESEVLREMLPPPEAIEDRPN
jgi:hypothetical protein